MLSFLVNAIVILIAVGFAIIGIGALVFAIASPKIDFFEGIEVGNNKKSNHERNISPNFDSDTTLNKTDNK